MSNETVTKPCKRCNELKPLIDKRVCASCKEVYRNRSKLSQMKEVGLYENWGVSRDGVFLRRCVCCKRSKPLDRFTTISSGDGYSKKCRDCKAASTL